MAWLELCSCFSARPAFSRARAAQVTKGKIPNVCDQLTIVSFADGAALWTGQPGEHLLHERHSAVSAVCARAQDCSQEVGFRSVCRPKSCSLVLKSFFTFRYSGALRSTGPNAPSDYITAALRDLYETMDKTSSSLPPIILLQFLHMAFPQFAEKGDQGQYLQQVRTLEWTQHLPMKR